MGRTSRSSNDWLLTNVQRPMRSILFIIKTTGITQCMGSIRCTSPQRRLGHLAIETLQLSRRSLGSRDLHDMLLRLHGGLDGSKFGRRDG